MLTTIIPAYNLTNMIKEPTCFKSNDPTIIDVMLVTKRRKILKSFSEGTGISDFHNLIGGILRIHKPPPKQKRITVRKMTSINYNKVISEIKQLNLEQQILCSSNANMAYDTLHHNLSTLLNKHAPKRVKIVFKNSFHCMSKELRKAITYRNKLRNKYYKSRLNHDLSLYKTQKNLVNEIKKTAIKKYFEEKCKEGTRNKDFWKAVKPLFSKYRTKSDSIPLCENNKIITDDQTVCNIFNSFFKNIGSEIGLQENNEKPLEEILLDHKEHESMKVIRNQIMKQKPHNFSFRFVSEKEVLKIVKSLSAKKSSGYDELTPKFIKMISSNILKPLTMVINHCFLENTFPNGTKKANITPLYKKKDKLNKDNYRSVNLLPVLSKVMEKIMYNQIYEHMTHYFHSYLSGFRKNHSCQDILMRMIEDWREALDNALSIGVIAIDLSKAFDCMPHGLLLGKLSAYGFDLASCHMMKSYLLNRQQRVKIGETMSDWVTNVKGVPQGSILGPLMFNIFINDLLHDTYHSKIYNYADDNTLAYANESCDTIKQKLTDDCLKIIKWFDKNSMKANANKFQLMFLTRDTHNTIEKLNIGSSEITSCHSINILGIEIDDKLTFNNQIIEMCSQAGKQINALKRIKQFLSKDSKMIVYNSYINSIFNYCSPIYMFISKANEGKLDKTNKRALRFVTNKFQKSYEEICKEECKLNIKRRYVKAIAITMFKVNRNSAPSYITELFKRQQTPYDMRDNEKLMLPSFNTVHFGKNSIKYYGAKLWNIIPTEIRNSSSLNTFKSGINKWLLTNSEELFS